MKLVFATANHNKIKEVQSLLPAFIEIQGLKDIGCFEEIPETHDTIEENSLEKAVYVHEKYGVDCFSEDSGLEVEALNGEPGVYSAHYAGSRSPENNIALLLHNLKGIHNRKAQFKTVFTLYMSGEIEQFTGIVTGNILHEARGTGGFGYDPVFLPDGAEKTFAEMSQEEKSRISHRAKAFELMTTYLKNHFHDSK